MEQAKLDKIRRVFERMDNEYWEEMAYHSGELEERLHEKSGELLDLLVELVVAQNEILSAKSSGYERVLQAANQAANPAKPAQTAVGGKGGKGGKNAAVKPSDTIEKIVADNTAKLASLAEKKQTKLSDLPKILADIQDVFDEAAKLGEVFTAKSAETDK